MPTGSLTASEQGVTSELLEEGVTTVCMKSAKKKEKEEKKFWA